MKKNLYLTEAEVADICTQPQKKSKKIICPKCKLEKVVEIGYGLPMPKTMDKAEKGELYLGGCCVDSDSPKYHCQTCGHEFGNLKGRFK